MKYSGYICRGDLSQLSYIQFKVVVVVSLFLTFCVLVAIPKKTSLHAGQSRSWCAERGNENKRESLAAHLPPPHAARLEKINLKSRDASTCLGATQVSIRLAFVQGFLRLVD